MQDVPFSVVQSFIALIYGMVTSWAGNAASALGSSACTVVPVAVGGAGLEYWEQEGRSWLVRRICLPYA